ncbi:hypothetical protein [Lysobacter sp. TY2-98]|uniref:hypothetical protein n=1 Tax=Lysobacter sp. TY2-98 TaxID=2290922 RepID=UPI0013B410E6|nr:hypothetical protein [Lysobacter sp. TY2-98]
MSSPAPAPAPALAQPAALAAFLRGVDRRAAVLAELQTGSSSIGDAALTRAMAVFREAALDAPMADWPTLFWRTLLAQPALRTARDGARLGLPPSSPAVRAALLLRVAAGLDEPTAAAVMGVAPEVQREAVIRALPKLADGGPDATAWTRLQREAQQRLRELPADRALELARIREGALAGTTERFFPQRRDHRWRWVAGLAAAVALGLVGTRYLGGAGDVVRVVPLPSAGEPASRYARESGLIAHPDFELLADPDGEKLAHDAAFLSWMVGHPARPASTTTATDATATTPDIPETSEATDAP